MLVSLFDLLIKWGFVLKRDYRFNTQLSTMTFNNGSEFIFMDLAPMPSDPNYDRMGSLEFTGGFIEEAAEVEQKAKDVLYSRIRYRIDEFGIIPKLLMTCNPHKGYLYINFYKPYKSKQLPQNRAFIQSLVHENPHISPHYIESLKKLKDPVLRARLYLGDWEYADDELSLFNYDALTDLFSNTVEESKEKYIISDIARFGPDKAIISLWEGLKCTKFIVYDKSSMPTLETEILVLAQQERVPMSHVLVDEGGIGGGVVDHLKCKGFVSNAPPFDEKSKREMREVEYKVNYQNLRTQCFYTLAEYVNDRIIRIDTDSEVYKNAIIEELEQIRARDVDKDVKFRIISKEDIKATLGRSPDFADTLMMRMYFEVKPEQAKTRVRSINPLA